MNRLLSIIATISVALWLGGLATLMLLVSGLFARAHELGAEVAPVLFERFAYYHLIVGAVAIVAVVLWRMRDARRVLTVLAICTGIGLASAMISEMLITPKMQQLRRDDQSGGQTFAQLHRASEIVYGIETLALAAAAGLLPFGSAGAGRRRSTSASGADETSREREPTTVD